MSIKERYSRFEKAATRKVIWESTYKDAMRYGTPHREMFDQHSKGDAKNNPDILFDSTAQAAGEDFCSALEDAIVPVNKKWISLIPGTDIPKEEKEDVTEKLNSITDTMFKFIHNSNFNIQIAESFTDLLPGTACIRVDEGDDVNPIVCLSVPINQLYLEEAENGAVKTVFRKHTMPIRNLQATWRKAIISEALQEKINNKPDDEIAVLESLIYDYKGDKYTYCVDIDQKFTILEEVMESSPFIVFRFSKLPGEVYGRGPLLKALPDIKTLNKAKELLLKSAALKMQGVFVVGDDGIINPHAIKIVPGGIIPAAPFGPGGSPIAALPVGGDLNLGQFIINDMREDIKKQMYADKLPELSGAVRSPTELKIRQEALSKKLGSPFNRIMFELVTPFISRVLYILNEKGLLPVDLSDVKVDGKEIALKYASPLAQAQNEEEIINMRRYVDEIKYAVGDQLLPLYVDIDDYSEQLASRLHIPDSMKMTDEKREAAAEKYKDVIPGQGNMPPEGIPS